METNAADTHYIVHEGDKFKMEIQFSEVCIHLGVAGKVMEVEVLGRGVQLYDETGRKFSFPILHSEAGIYTGGSLTDDPTLHSYWVPKEYVRLPEEPKE